jgi:FG-GAP repeat
MKKLLPILILIFAFTAFGYNRTSLNDLITAGEFSIENAEIKLSASEYNQAVYNKTATIIAGEQIFSANQAPGIECDYSLSYFNTNVEATGGTGSVNVIAGNGCNWTAVSNTSWIIITSGATGNGNGTVNFSVATNSGPARSGTVTIGGRTFTVNQANGCTYTLSSTSASIRASGDTGTVNVTAQHGCNWWSISNVSWITLTGISIGTGSGWVNFFVAPNTGPARTGTITIAGQTFTVNQQAVAIPQRRTLFDFDGDGKADFSIYRPSVGEWWYQRSSDGGNRAFQFGTSTDKIVPADYTGDGKTDFAFYRKGEWFILRSEDFSYYAFPFGVESDIPVPAGYDGDGKSDPAVFRPSTSVWYILQSSGGVRIEQFGSGGKPVPADYDGDKRADLAVYNALTNQFRIRYAASEATLAIFVANGSLVSAADYTGDNAADIAFYNPSTNAWRIIDLRGAVESFVQFGSPGDIPAPGDYDGDGKTDIAIYRPTTTEWWYAASSANGESKTARFGISTDIPVPSAYVR